MSEADRTLFPGFDARRVTVPGVDLHVVVGGRGPPLLLLHGFPQTHAMWHRLAPALAPTYTVVCPDLRGYGDSGKPPSDAQHGPYTKRAMAADAVALMRALGFARFDVAGHDRGGRVVHRLCLDHPQAVARAAVIDICPTRTMYARTDQAFATAYYHWFFLIQPEDFPERLIGADPRYYLRATLSRWSGSGLPAFDPLALAEYERCFGDRAAIHAACEDYRAAASTDLLHDGQSIADGERIGAPLLVLWGTKGTVHRLFAPLDDWKAVAADVRGRALPTGHFVPEEAPDDTLEELATFFA